MNRKEKEKNKLLLAALGKGHREDYLDRNPHGFAKATTCVANKKKYNRKKRDVCAV